MAHYETTVRLTHISTSTKGRSGLSVADAVGAAKANLRYITQVFAKATLGATRTQEKKVIKINCLER